MPKEVKTPMSTHASASAPYPTPTSAGPRTAGIWSTADDEILLRARAGGKNWQPISDTYFPNKSANACRKRHERLVEKRQGEDWDALKLELLAQEYMAVRKQMWEILASRVDERWSVVEAKCMEKGLKNLQTAARSAHRKAAAGPNDSFDDQGTTDHHSDSGIGLGSDAEMEVDGNAGASTKASSWHARTGSPPPQQDHLRSRSLPQDLPLYQPPPPIITHHQMFDAPITTSPQTQTTFRHPTSYQRYSPEFQNGRGGISIQSVLSPAEPHRA